MNAAMSAGLPVEVVVSMEGEGSKTLDGVILPILQRPGQFFEIPLNPGEAKKKVAVSTAPLPYTSL